MVLIVERVVCEAEVVDAKEDRTERYDPSPLHQTEATDNQQREITAHFKWNGPERTVDRTRMHIVFKYAGKDIADRGDFQVTQKVT